MERKKKKGICIPSTSAEEMEICFTDLTPEAQQRVLNFLKIKNPEEANLDVFPLTTIPAPTD